MCACMGTKSTMARSMLSPLGDRVVVQVDKAEATTEGGIIIPDKAQERPLRGTVIAVGPGRILDCGSQTPVRVDNGAKVIFPTYAGHKFEHGGVELLVMAEDELLCVVS